MRTKFFILASLLLAFFPLCGQDIHFSQLTEAPAFLNPGTTGNFAGYQRAIINYRNQWSAMGAAYKTMAGSFDMNVMQDKATRGYLGLGLNFFSDKAGDGNFTTTQGSLAVCGIIPMSGTSKVSLGIQGGYAQRSVNVNSLTWATQYTGTGFDPKISSGESFLNSSFGYVDLSAGFFYEYSDSREGLERNENMRFNFGVAGFHLNQPKQKFSSFGGEKLDMRIVGHTWGRYEFPMSKLSLVPSLVYMMQGPHTELTGGTSLRYRLRNGTKVTGYYTETAIAFGVSYRLKDAVIPQLWFEAEKFAIGVSYDVNVSTYKDVSHLNGGFEISLRYNNLKGALFSTKPGF